MATAQIKYENKSLFPSESVLTVTLSLFFAFLREGRRAPEWACEYSSCKLMYSLNAYGVGGLVIDVNQLAEDLCMPLELFRTSINNFVLTLEQTAEARLSPEAVNATLHPGIDQIATPIDVSVITQQCVDILQLMESLPPNRHGAEVHQRNSR